MQLIQLCKSRHIENRYDFCILTNIRYWLDDGYLIYNPEPYSRNRGYYVALDSSIVQILEELEC